MLSKRIQLAAKDLDLALQSLELSFPGMVLYRNTGGVTPTEWVPARGMSLHLRWGLFAARAIQGGGRGDAAGSALRVTASIPIRLEGRERGYALRKSAQIGHEGGGKLGERQTARPTFGQQPLEGLVCVVVGQSCCASEIRKRARGSRPVSPCFTQLSQVAAIGREAGTQKLWCPLSFINRKEKNHSEHCDDGAGEGVQRSHHGELPIAGVGQPCEHKCRSEEKGEGRVATGRIARASSTSGKSTAAFTS